MSETDGLRSVVPTWMSSDQISWADCIWLCLRGSPSLGSGGLHSVVPRLGSVVPGGLRSVVPGWIFRVEIKFPQRIAFSCAWGGSPGLGSGVAAVSRSLVSAAPHLACLLSPRRQLQHPTPGHPHQPPPHCALQMIQSEHQRFSAFKPWQRRHTSANCIGVKFRGLLEMIRWLQIWCRSCSETGHLF